MNGMIMRLAQQCHLPHHDIYDITIAGNTTMQQLLCGLDPRALAESPYTPVFTEAMRYRAAEIGLQANRDALIYIFPQIGGFVGGDTVAAVLAARLTKRKGTTLMVDIGTNGEIVLAKDGRMYASSTAAGPAFEGARIRNGMRARTGAIEKVVIRDDVVCDIIGGVGALGLCGSGLIDAAAELLRCGIISQNGRLLPPHELPENVPDALRRRVRMNDQDDTAFLLAHTPGADPVTLTQRDVRELQLATGAIRGGVNVLLEIAGASATDITEVRIAGGFGSFIRRRNAQRIGLMPPDVPRERIRYVGNASLSGARWALLCRDARARAETIARACTHVELSSHPQFDMAFAMAMLFPET